MKSFKRKQQCYSGKAQRKREREMREKTYREAQRLEQEKQIQYLSKRLENNPDRIVVLPDSTRVPSKVALAMLESGMLQAIALNAKYKAMMQEDCRRALDEFYNQLFVDKDS